MDDDRCEENCTDNKTIEDALDEVDVKDQHVMDLEEKNVKNYEEGDETQVMNESIVKTRKVSDDKPDGSPVNVNDEENDEAEEIS